MKHKHLLCAAMLAVCMMSAGCAQKSQAPYIGTEEAKRLALEDAGIPASEAEFTTASLTNRSGQDYYQIDFISAGESYKYDIDAITGVIIQAAVPGDNSDTSADSGSNAGTSDSSLHESSNAGADGSNLNTDAADSNLNTDTAAATANAEITPDEAKEKALAHAKLTSMQAMFTKCRLGYGHGRYIYEIEFYTADHKEYDYEIDAFSGEVVSFDYDLDYPYTKDHSGAAAHSDTEDHAYTEDHSEEGHSEGENHHYTADNKITPEKAKELALAQVPGAAARHIREFETDYDDGRIEYEGKIVYNGMEYEFEIDAYSGAFRGWHAEPADD